MLNSENGLPEEETRSPSDPLTKERKFRSKKQKERDFNRKKAFNARKSDKDLDDIAAKIKAQLWYGFDNVDDAAETVGVSTTNETQIVPVTTRGVGMLCQTLFNNIATNLPQPPQCDVYSLYRVSMLQLQLKLETCQADAGVPPYPAQYRWNAGLDYNTKELVRANHINLGPVTTLISSIGRVSMNGQSYLPVVEQTIVMETLTYEVMRPFVERISNPATPPEERTLAYEANALPGSVWFEVEGTMALGNPDDIIPAVYTQQQMILDFERVRGLMNFAARKGFKGLTSSCSIDYSGKGSPWLLVSNRRGQCRLEPASIFRRVPEGESSTGQKRSRRTFSGAQYYRAENRERPMTTGELREFWSPETLAKGQAYMGGVLLLGEVSDTLTQENLRRQRRASRAQYAFSWVAAYSAATSRWLASD